MRGVQPWVLGSLIAAAVVACGQTPPEVAAPGSTGITAARVGPGTYTNPLALRDGSNTVQSCADPTVIRAHDPNDANWYLYCTTDPFDGDRDANGNLEFHLIPTFKSADLVNWSYVGDAFTARPAWVADNAGLWAPDVAFFDGLYHLYYTASDTKLPGGGSAIGVATSPGPAGPWTDAGAPAVEPHAADCCPGSRRWVFDPEVVRTPDGQKFIYYGSYFGGLSVRALSADGLHSDPATQVQVAIANRYEGASVVRHGDYYYLLASATNCCNGPLTGYSVFAGRATSPLGPFVDRDGASFLQGRVGGTPVISMNGNRWVGPGHDDVITDFAGQDWLVYHAVDQSDPYFAGATGFTKRPALIDRLDWVNGWPTVRGGAWASDSPQPAPAAQPGQRATGASRLARPDVPAERLDAFSDDFDGGTLGNRWSWVREPASGTYGVSDGALRFDTQAADLYVDSNNASVLLEAAPDDDYIVETRVRVDVPAEGCCYNYVQAGLVVYGDDDNFVKLTSASIWETRQTEFAKELAPVPDGYPRYGNTVAGTPGEWTWLRVARRATSDGETYTAYTSADGERWVRGGTWTHRLGGSARIGLVSMGGSGFHATFDYVRVFTVRR